MGKILVKAAPQIQIGPDGKPQMYYNVGVGGGDRGGDGARGRTKRSRVGGALGGAIGVLGGLSGESRSLGGFLSNLQVGAMQGSALGRGIADSRLVTSRRRQARADLVEGRKQAQAKDDAQARLRGEEEYAQRPSPFSSFGPYSNIASPKQNFMRRVSGRNMTNFGRQIQQEEGRLQEEARVRAQQQRELDKQGFKGDVRQFMQAQSKLPSQEAVNVVGNLAGTAAPVGQQLQVPQGPIPPPEHGAASQSDEKVNAQGTGTQAFQNHTNISTENAEQEVQEMQGGDGDKEGQQGQQGGGGIGRGGFDDMDDNAARTLLGLNNGGQR